MCRVDKFTYVLTLPRHAGIKGDSLPAWQVSHVVKHLVAAADDELHRVLNIDRDKIRMLHKMLTEEFSCQLLANGNLQNNRKIYVCHDCSSLQRCREALSDCIDTYTAYLQNVVRDDVKKPRHIYYSTSQEKGNLGFVDNAGVIVYTKQRSDKLVLKTGFRPLQDTALINSTMVQLRHFSNAYFLRLAIKTIQRKIDRGSFRNSRMVTRHNWQ